ncbi:DNA-binding protein [Scytonema sp. UIC 10036]|uniref:DNA-binding protein n=1 Tax=Scytonema sp. UIC 10036 TaxID=2304196 RepID=UPI00140FEBB0|nr:DNA-binding protein [Scytonema sp. UIC 10036]
MEVEKSLKEKVFETCDIMAREKKSITRNAVRACTGGSDRDVSRYIAEWKAEYQRSAIEVSTKGAVSQQSEESAAIDDGSVPPSGTESGTGFGTGTGAYSQNPEDDIAAVARRGAERAAAMLAGESVLTNYFLENPDKLPDDLKQQVKTMQNRGNQLTAARQQQYNPDFFVARAIASLQ